jgi:hypothetical protein
MIAATHKLVNGQRVDLTPGEIAATEAEWATNLLAGEKQRLIGEAKQRLAATADERADLAVAVALDPGRRPDLQSLEDYRTSLKAMPATITAGLDAVGVKPWPEKSEIVVAWPVRA